MEHIDLFILYSQYHGCWWPGDASSHGLMKPEYSSTPAADAVAPCITRPSAPPPPPPPPVILTMQNKEVLVIESFTWGTRTCLSCIVNILCADGLGTKGATAYWKLNFLGYLRLCHCCCWCIGLGVLEYSGFWAFCHLLLFHKYRFLEEV